MRKKKEPLSFVDKMKKLTRSGLANSPPANRSTSIDPDWPSLSERVEKLMGFIKRDKQNPLNMIYFVMYDIEDNRVRNQVARYLIKKGCARVQKSIFIANPAVRSSTKYKPTCAKYNSVTITTTVFCSCLFRPTKYAP
jgi:CRISPR-associated protein Cas2